MAVLKRRHQFFQRRISRIVVAGIAIAVFFAAQHAVKLRGAFVDITGGSVNRRGDRDESSWLGWIGLAVATVDGFGFDFHFFLFQAVPSLVSSKIMPASSN